MDNDEQEIKRINRELCSKYPFLIPYDWSGHSLEDNPDWDYSLTWRDDVSFGWKHLFDLMCDELLDVIKGTGYFKTFRFGEVKSKFGELRIYSYDGNAETNRIIDKWCFLSGYVCETCGKPEVRITRGWIQAICFDCWSKFHSPDYEDYIRHTGAVTYPPVLKITKLTNKVRTQTEINLEAEYQRLIDDWNMEEI